MTEGIIATDSTRNSFEDARPNGVNLVSVAVSVTDVAEFESRYFAIIAQALDEYGINSEHPLIKSEHISRYVVDWRRKEARRSLVSELLDIDVLDTIFVTETYLRPQWIDLYEENPNVNRRESADKFVNDILSSYYEIVSVWKYLERYADGDATHRNVMTDDFTGQVCRAWDRIGELSETFVAVPQGDQTYPILSMADLLTGLLKQEVYPLRAGEIEDYLKSRTAAYVNTASVHKGEDLSSVVPYSTDGIRTELHYPDPTVYLERGSLSKKKVKSLDIFEKACMYAHSAGGCVKFLEENSDRHHFTSDDMILCLDGDPGSLRDYEYLNNTKSVTVTSPDDAVVTFNEAIDVR